MRRVDRALLAFVLACGFVSGALAQPARPAEALLVDRLVSMAKAMSGGTPAQQQIAAVLFEKAQALSPIDAPLTRAYLQLASTALADDDLVSRLTRRLAGLEPENQRAMVEVITLDALRQQTVADRVALIKRVLDPDQERTLPAPVRAELAARAASWAFDANDLASVDALLRVATQADPANGLAAALQYRYIQSQEATQAAQAAAAVDWLLASPTELRPRLQVAQAVLDAGDYEGAAQQFRVAHGLVTAAGSLLPPSAIVGQAAALIGSGRPREAVDWINTHVQALGGARVPLDWLLLRQVALFNPPAPTKAPTQAASEAAVPGGQQGQRQSPDDAFLELMAAFDDLIARGGDGVRIDKAWSAAMLAPDPGSVPPLLEGLPADDPRVILARGWVAARTGDRQTATPLLQQIGRTDRAALLGLATLQPPDRQAAFLNAISHDEPASLVSLLAVHRLYGLKGRPEVSPAGEMIAGLLQRVPFRLRQMDFRSGAWVRVALTLDEGLDAMSPITGTLQIRNNLTSPVRLGPGGAAPDWMLIQTQAATDGRGVPGLSPVFVSLTPVLSVPGRTTVDLPVRLDRTPMGDALIGNPWRDWRLILTAISDPRQAVQESVNGPQSRLVAGPLGSVDIFRVSLRPEPALTAETLAALAAEAKTAGPGRAAAWGRLIPLLVSQDPAQAAAIGAEKDALVDALLADFPSMPPREQGWVLWSIPAFTGPAEVFASIGQDAARSESALVRAVYLLRHTDPSDQDAINAAKRLGDPAVTAIAEAMAAMAAEAAEPQEAAPPADGSLPSAP